MIQQMEEWQNACQAEIDQALLETRNSPIGTLQIFPYFTLQHTGGNPAIPGNTYRGLPDAGSRSLPGDYN